MKVAIGADHRGAEVLKSVVDQLRGDSHEAQVFGSCEEAMSDYPDIAFPVAQAVANGTMDRGILICGSGIGMSIAANKVIGARAAVVHDELSAEIARRHNDANVLCLSADLLGARVIGRIVTMWLKTEFEGGRHTRRVAKIAAIERGEDPTTGVPDCGESRVPKPVSN